MIQVLFGQTLKPSPDFNIWEKPVSNLMTLPETGFVRLSQIIGNPRANPPIPPIIPVSRSSWWLGVQTGRFPRPVRLGPRTVAWRVADLRALIDHYNGAK